jgi:hypothetical protein
MTKLFRRLLQDFGLCPSLIDHITIKCIIQANSVLCSHKERLKMAENSERCKNADNDAAGEI